MAASISPAERRKTLNVFKQHFDSVGDFDSFVDALEVDYLARTGAYGPTSHSSVLKPSDLNRLHSPSDLNGNQSRTDSDPESAFM